METILLTGAGGYVGSNAAEYFVRQGYRVIGTVHRNIAERLKTSGAEIRTADLTVAREVESPPDWRAVAPADRLAVVARYWQGCFH